VHVRILVMLGTCYASSSGSCFVLNAAADFRDDVQHA
jgi:hypothetical protein